MACQKVCKQGRNDAWKQRSTYRQSPIPTFYKLNLHTYLLAVVLCNLSYEFPSFLVFCISIPLQIKNTKFCLLQQHPCKWPVARKFRRGGDAIMLLTVGTCCVAANGDRCKCFPPLAQRVEAQRINHFWKPYMKPLDKTFASISSIHPWAIPVSSIVNTVVWLWLWQRCIFVFTLIHNSTVTLPPSHDTLTCGIVMPIVLSFHSALQQQNYFRRRWFFYRQWTTYEWYTHTHPLPMGLIATV